MLYLAFYPPKSRLENRNREHDLGRRLLLHGLEREYGLAPEESVVEQKEGKKPRLLGHPEIRFNLSHCEGAVLCGISGEEIGVDIEVIRPFSWKLARRILTPREYEHLSGVCGEEQEACFFCYWTLKESFSKALGTGLAEPFQKLEVSWDDHGTVSSNKSGCLFVQRRIGGRYQAAVCILGGHNEIHVLGAGARCAFMYKKERGRRYDL